MQRDTSSSTLDSFFSQSTTSPPSRTLSSHDLSHIVKRESGYEADDHTGGGVTSSPERTKRSTTPPAAAPAKQQQTASGKTSPTSTKASSATPHKRIVCDHCRRRRIRCDGKVPCQQCLHATLTCKRDHVPKKRGPKRGHGRVIDELREHDKQAAAPTSGATSSTTDFANRGQPFYLGSQPPYMNTTGLGLQDVDYYEGSLYFDSSAPTSGAPTGPSSPIAEYATYFPPSTTTTAIAVPVPPVAPPPVGPPLQMAMPGRSAPRHSSSEPTSPYTTDAFRPNSRDYSYLIPRCLELYYEHIYPIMPVLYMPAVRNTIQRPMSKSEKNLIFAMSALVCFHMSGKSMASPDAPNWEIAGKFFLDECISVRQEYDFLEDVSLSAVISSFWLSTSFFEINQNRKSWYYLREALTLAMDMGLDDDKSYQGLSSEEILCRRRVFWILYVTERSFAILRNKPITLRKTPTLPTKGHSYEDRDIHHGFIKLVRSYIPLDESFVNAWNDGSDPKVSATTYLNLQQLLAQPLDFLLKPSRRRSSGLSRLTATLSGGSTSPVGSTNSEEEPEPTDIQKADLLMTQQWLRLIVWQSSFRQGLLSTATADESMTFSYPLSIAKDTAAILQSLPSHAVEVHGMGIMEKIFEIGTWCVNVLNAYETGPKSPSMPFGGAADGSVAGMDYVGGGDMGVLSLNHRGGRWAPTIDPLEFFVKTLSASPNSRAMFAEKLLMLVEESPGAMRASLSPGLQINAADAAAAGLFFGAGNIFGQPAATGTAATSGVVVEETRENGGIAELDRGSLSTNLPTVLSATDLLPDEMDLSPTSYSFSNLGLGGNVPSGTGNNGHTAARPSISHSMFSDDGAAMAMLSSTTTNQSTNDEDEIVYYDNQNGEYSFSRVDPGSLSAATNPAAAVVAAGLGYNHRFGVDAGAPGMGPASQRHGHQQQRSIDVDSGMMDYQQQDLQQAQQSQQSQQQLHSRTHSRQQSSGTAHQLW